MKRSHAWLLIVAAAWSVFVWVSFVLIQLRSADPSDRTLGFRAVHFTLAGVSVLLALAVGYIGLRALRRQAPPARARGDLTSARS